MVKYDLLKTPRDKGKEVSKNEEFSAGKVSLVLGRKMRECTDYRDYIDTDGWTCGHYAQTEPCGGSDKWQWGDISNYGDSNGVSALDACCACGG